MNWPRLGSNKSSFELKIDKKKLRSIIKYSKNSIYRAKEVVSIDINQIVAKKYPNLPPKFKVSINNHLGRHCLVEVLFHFTNSKRYTKRFILLYKNKCKSCFKLPKKFKVRETKNRYVEFHYPSGQHIVYYKGVLCPKRNLRFKNDGEFLTIMDKRLNKLLVNWNTSDRRIYFSMPGLERYVSGITLGCNMERVLLLSEQLLGKKELKKFLIHKPFVLTKENQSEFSNGYKNAVLFLLWVNKVSPQLRSIPKEIMQFEIIQYLSEDDLFPVFSKMFVYCKFLDGIVNNNSKLEVYQAYKEHPFHKCRNLFEKISYVHFYQISFLKFNIRKNIFVPVIEKLVELFCEVTAKTRTDIFEYYFMQLYKIMDKFIIPHFEMNIPKIIKINQKVVQLIVEDDYARECLPVMLKLLSKKIITRSPELKCEEIYGHDINTLLKILCEKRENGNIKIVALMMIHKFGDTIRLEDCKKELMELSKSMIRNIRPKKNETIMKFLRKIVKEQNRKESTNFFLGCLKNKIVNATMKSKDIVWMRYIFVENIDMLKNDERMRIMACELMTEWRCDECFRSVVSFIGENRSLYTQEFLHLVLAKILHTGRGKITRKLKRMVLFQSNTFQNTFIFKYSDNQESEAKGQYLFRSDFPIQTIFFSQPNVSFMMEVEATFLDRQFFLEIKKKVDKSTHKQFLDYGRKYLVRTKVVVELHHVIEELGLKNTGYFEGLKLLKKHIEKMNQLEEFSDEEIVRYLFTNRMLQEYFRGKFRPYIKKYTKLERKKQLGFGEFFKFRNIFYSKQEQPNDHLRKVGSDILLTIIEGIGNMKNGVNIKDFVTVTIRKYNEYFDDESFSKQHILTLSFIILNILKLEKSFLHYDLPILSLFFKMTIKSFIATENRKSAARMFLLVFIRLFKDERSVLATEGIDLMNIFAILLNFCKKKWSKNHDLITHTFKLLNNDEFLLKKNLLGVVKDGKNGKDEILIIHLMKSISVKMNNNEPYCEVVEKALSSIGEEEIVQSPEILKQLFHFAHRISRWQSRYSLIRTNSNTDFTSGDFKTVNYKYYTLFWDFAVSAVEMEIICGCEMIVKILEGKFLNYVFSDRDDFQYCVVESIKTHLRKIISKAKDIKKVIFATKKNLSFPELPTDFLRIFCSAIIKRYSECEIDDEEVTISVGKMKRFLYTTKKKEKESGDGTKEVFFKVGKILNNPSGKKKVFRKIKINDELQIGKKIVEGMILGGKGEDEEKETITKIKEKEGLLVFNFDIAGNGFHILGKETDERGKEEEEEIVFDFSIE